MNVRSSTKKMFSQEEMLRFGRYLSNGNKSVSSIFDSWFDGPPEARRVRSVWKRGTVKRPVQAKKKIYLKKNELSILILLFSTEKDIDELRSKLPEDFPCLLMNYPVEIRNYNDSVIIKLAEREFTKKLRDLLKNLNFSTLK